MAIGKESWYVRLVAERAKVLFPYGLWLMLSTILVAMKQTKIMNAERFFPKDHSDHFETRHVYAPTVVCRLTIIL